ncbi:MAG: hypothetical protein ACYS0H_01835 [Planctomycetota bacterium]|jgi:hypothetical protein
MSTSFRCLRPREGRFDGEIFGRVLDLAWETRQGNNPAGLFMALLKKELGYSGQVKR